MAKNKKMLFIGLAICITLIIGMFYWNSNRIVSDEVVFIGEPPEFFYMVSPNTDGDIWVAWYQVENATSYKLYRNIDGGDFELIAQESHDPSNFYVYIIDWDLTDGQYGYKVKAIHIDGESDFSNVEFVVVQLV